MFDFQAGTNTGFLALITLLAWLFKRQIRDYDMRLEKLEALLTTQATEVAILVGRQLERDQNGER